MRHSRARAHTLPLSHSPIHTHTHTLPYTTPPPYHHCPQVLKNLYIGGNPIGEAGAKALALALEVNTALVGLFLGGNGGSGERGKRAVEERTPTTLAAIIAALQCNKSVECRRKKEIRTDRLRGLEGHTCSAPTTTSSSAASSSGNYSQPSREGGVARESRML